MDDKPTDLAIHIEDIASNETWTPAEEQRVRRSLDYHIVPIVFILYLLCSLDRANLGNARIQGLEKNLNLYGYRFHWALTVFYIGYFIIEIPSNVLLKKIGAKYYLPGLVVSFGLVSMCAAFVHNYGGLMACRSMLGITEGGLMPGLAYYLSCFYRRNELLLRIGFFINGACFAGGFGGLLAGGLSQIPPWGADSMRIHTWRNIFLVEGLLTIVIGLISMYYMVDTPMDCRWFSDRQRHIAAERINQEYQEGTQLNVTKNDIYRGICNINTIICGLCFMFANIAVQSLALFMPTILVALGYTSIRAQFYTVPVYAVATVVSLVMSWLSDKLRRRGLFIYAGALIALTGYAMLANLDHKRQPQVKYAAVYIAAIGIFFIGTTVLAWCLNNVANSGRRAVASAFVVVMGNFGSVIATWAYLPTDAPGYKIGHYINLGAEATVCALGLAGIIYVRWENRVREHGGRDDRLVGLTDDEVQTLGFRHPEFRYIE